MIVKKINLEILILFQSPTSEFEGEVFGMSCLLDNVPCWHITGWMDSVYPPWVTVC
jgi:hypothetical protein